MPKVFISHPVSSILLPLEVFILMKLRARFLEVRILKELARNAKIAYSHI